ncbi:hypothetical protein IQ06DRAFT_105391 [Phaeosphaeriaceae sp. SRC1lsM3a]|nr:hypothetical protein IQ06DRAFT_105391 [Stagonospora sp. SRC1lsM3a]
MHADGHPTWTKQIPLDALPACRLQVRAHLQYCRRALRRKMRAKGCSSVRDCCPSSPPALRHLTRPRQSSIRLCYSKCLSSLPIALADSLIIILRHRTPDATGVGLWLGRFLIRLRRLCFHRSPPWRGGPLTPRLSFMQCPWPWPSFLLSIGTTCLSAASSFYFPGTLSSVHFQATIYAAFHLKHPLAQ